MNTEYLYDDNGTATILKKAASLIHLYHVSGQVINIGLGTQWYGYEGINTDV